MEVDVDHQANRNRVSLVRGRLELVLAHSLDGFLVQPHAEVTDHRDVLRITVGVHDQLNLDRSLQLCLAGFISELRLHLMQQDRSRDAPANAHDAAAVATTDARAKTTAMAGSDAAAQALAEAGIAARSLRSHRHLWRIGHADIRP